MSPILRHSPGEFAPADGHYILVGHYGEATSFSVWRIKGERFPQIAVPAEDIGPVWYVLADETNQAARVA